MGFREKDFIEIEFTGKTIEDGEIFDSNIKEDLEKIYQGHNHPTETKPFIFSLGQGMFMKGIDDFLIGKDMGEHEVSLKPEEAFGKRDPKLIRMVPMKFFKENKLNPIQGTIFNFDGRAGKIITVSGGRVLVDFNNQLAGKDVVYKIKVLRKIDDTNEKVSSFIDFLFKKPLDFEIKDGKLIIKAEKQIKNFVEMFKDKFKEILELELEVEDFEKMEKEKPESGKVNSEQTEKKEEEKPTN